MPWYMNALVRHIMSAASHLMVLTCQLAERVGWILKGCTASVIAEMFADLWGALKKLTQVDAGIGAAGKRRPDMGYSTFAADLSLHTGWRTSYSLAPLMMGCSSVIDVTTLLASIQRIYFQERTLITLLIWQQRAEPLGRFDQCQSRCERSCPLLGRSLAGSQANPKSLHQWQQEQKSSLTHNGKRPSIQRLAAKRTRISEKKCPMSSDINWKSRTGQRCEESRVGQCQTKPKSGLVNHVERESRLKQHVTGGER